MHFCEDIAKWTGVYEVYLFFWSRFWFRSSSMLQIAHKHILARKKNYWNLVVHEANTNCSKYTTRGNMLIAIVFISAKYPSIVLRAGVSQLINKDGNCQNFIFQVCCFVFMKNSYLPLFTRSFRRCKIRLTQRHRQWFLGRILDSRLARRWRCLKLRRREHNQFPQHPQR